MSARRVDTGRDLDPVSEAVRRDLMRAVAQRAAAVTGTEVRRRMPKLQHGEVNALRYERITGWDRLNAAAIRFDIDIGAIWRRHQQIGEAA